MWMERVYLSIVSYSFRSMLEPNRATSCSSYWAMLLSMISLHEPRRRSNVCASITADTEKDRKIYIYWSTLDWYVFLQCE